MLTLLVSVTIATQRDHLHTISCTANLTIKKGLEVKEIKEI